jgi:hypothetical protein
MIITQDILRRDTIRIIKKVDAQIETVEKAAQEMGFPPEELKDAHGNWVMIPLLLAKAQAYHTLVLLQPVK